MHYSPYDPYGRYLHTFAKRFPQALFRYVVLPPQEDVPYLLWFEPHVPPLQEFLSNVQVAQGDVLELFVLNKRVAFQGAQIEILSPVDHVKFTPVMNTPTKFDMIDCSVKGVATYLPQGGVLDKNTSLTPQQFVIDHPDYFGIRFDEASGSIDQLQFQVTLLVNEDFGPELPPNASVLRP